MRRLGWILLGAALCLRRLQPRRPTPCRRRSGRRRRASSRSRTTASTARLVPASRSSICKDDFNEAKAEGKRFAVIFEQRGCTYCISCIPTCWRRSYINDYVRQNFRIVQLDLWGAREVTDFDGKVMSEKALAERWGVIFTPTIVFFKDDLTGLDGKWGRELEATERLPLGFGPDTFYDLFVWVRHKIYRARPELPALPHFPHRRARGAEGHGAAQGQLAE